MTDAESHDSLTCWTCLTFPVGYGGADPSQLWVSPHLIRLGRIDTPAVIWECDGTKVTRTYRPDRPRPSGKPNPPQRIWILTDKYDLLGCQPGRLGYHLAVWPD